MKKQFTIWFLALWVAACSRNAVTGRNQIKVYSDEKVVSMAAEQYNQYLASHTVIDPGTGNADADRLRRVGDRLTVAVSDYYRGLASSEVLANYAWEFHLVRSAEINLWCVPGGKAVVYTGLASVVDDEPALAILLAHEIGHTLAHHVHNGLAQPMAKQLGDVGLSVAGVNKPIENEVASKPDSAAPDTESLTPFSNRQELEADQLGLKLAAMAGYDPRIAEKTWEKFRMIYVNNKPCALLKSHPLDNKRLTSMKKEMANAATVFRTDSTAH